MYFVYILKSIRDDTHYIGFTSKSPEERLQEHNMGNSKYTKGHTPYFLLTYQPFSTKKEAKYMKAYYKRCKKTDKVIKLMGSPDSKNRD